MTSEKIKSCFAITLLAGTMSSVLIAVPVSVERLFALGDGAGVSQIANAQTKGQGTGKYQGATGGNRGGANAGAGGAGSGGGTTLPSANRGGANAGGGGTGSGGETTMPSATEEDSDRPSWAGQGGGGNPNPGAGDSDSDRPAWAGRGAEKPGGGGKPATDLGDLYGDLYVILRDANGVPILKEIVTETGTIYVAQPLDADGNLIPLDDEGHAIDEQLLQTVELSRLNVARAPDKVTDRSLAKAISTLNAATDVKTDEAGRIVVLIDGEWKTVDSPIENLALYMDLLADGSIEGVTNPIVLNAFPSLFDGDLTSADLTTAASLLAATADKFTSLTLDAVMYINNIVGVNDPSTGTYVDLSSISYTRSDVYGDAMAQVLLDLDGDGVWQLETVNIYDAVFSNTDVSATNAAGFAQAVDDARAVINFIHEYAVPVSSVN